jgi:hypothetical protein
MRAEFEIHWTEFARSVYDESERKWTERKRQVWETTSNMAKAIERAEFIERDYCQAEQEDLAERIEQQREQDRTARGSLPEPACCRNLGWGSCRAEPAQKFIHIPAIKPAAIATPI